MLVDGTPLVGAQDNLALTTAHALLDRLHSGGIAIGTVSPPGQEPYIYMIITDPSVILDQPVGYVHEVDPANFNLESDKIGQKKWMSKQPVEVIAESVPVTPQEVMNNVQIFVVNEPKLIEEITKDENRPRHLSILTRELEKPLAERRIEWLNQTRDINPVRLPKIPQATAAETRFVHGS
jgi:hypothetical protein